MTEQEIRQIIREEIIIAFKELYAITEEKTLLSDGWGTYYGTRPKYDKKQCFVELARRLALEMKDDKQ